MKKSDLSITVIVILVFFTVTCFLLTGCSRILSERNVRDAMELLMNTEQLSQMRDAKDWEIEVVVGNEYGELIFYGQGDSCERAGRMLTRNLPDLVIKTEENE